MEIRLATLDDISQIQIVRNSVKENVLSNPSLVTDEHCALYLTEKGRGWVCCMQHTVVGFAIVDLVGHNIWALFVLPEYERMGIGSKLHKRMLDWYFDQTNETVWLSTSPNTRAEIFYTQKGWQAVGLYGDNEIKFEMSKNRYHSISV